MDRREILTLRFGEMQDMIACLSVYEGTALPKTQKKRITDFAEAIKLR
jgi:hypothetical protein